MTRVFCVLLIYLALPAAVVGAEGGSASLAAINTLAQARGLPDFREERLQVDGHALHYVTAGEGPLVVFHHGFPSYWYMWKHQLLDLVRDHRVVALDGLGYNLSDKPADIKAYRVEGLARQLDGFLRRIAGKEQYVLVGHDWGAALAWTTAQAYPRGMAKIVAISAPPVNLFLELLEQNPRQRIASRYMSRLKALNSDGPPGTAEVDRLYHLSYKTLLDTGLLTAAEGALFRGALMRPRALESAINWYVANVPAPDAIGDDDYWPGRASGTDVQSLLIWGEDDRTFVPEFLQRLPDYAPGVRIEVLPGVRHWPPLEQPEAVNVLIRRFIDG